MIVCGVLGEELSRWCRWSFVRQETADSIFCGGDFDRARRLSKVDEVGGSFRWQRKRCTISHAVT